MSEDRLKEAQECINKAEKLLKTCIWQLKTKPEYDLASYEYDRAAICYKNAGKFDKSVEMYLKSAECHKNVNNKFHEAKSKEQAAMVAKEGNDLDKATVLFEESAKIYLDANSWDTASQVIDKAGKILEQADISKAIKLYERGINIVIEADRAKTVCQLSHRLLGLYLRQKNYEEATKLSKNLIGTYKDNEDFGKIGQVGLGLVIISLLKDDSVEATRNLGYLADSGTANLSNEMQAAKSLIFNYENGDDAGLQNALKGGTIRAMDNHYLRIIKDLKAPLGGEKGIGGDNGEEEDEDLK